MDSDWLDCLLDPDPLVRASGNRARSSARRSGVITAARILASVVHCSLFLLGSFMLKSLTTIQSAFDTSYGAASEFQCFGHRVIGVEVCHLRMGVDPVVLGLLGDVKAIEVDRSGV